MRVSPPPPGRPPSRPKPVAATGPGNRVARRAIPSLQAARRRRDVCRRHGARHRYTPRRRREIGRWLGRLTTACGVLAGLGLIAYAVLFGASAGAEEDPPSPAMPTTGFQWPLDGSPEVTRPFDPPPEPWRAGHRGVDLAGTPGATVRAAGPGVVHFAGPVAGRGVVSIRHPNGLLTTYEPVTPSVTAGQRVRAGDVIGHLNPGHPGCPATACLHWGLRYGKTYLNPLALLGYGKVRLLPLTPDD